MCSSFCHGSGIHFLFVGYGFVSCDDSKFEWLFIFICSNVKRYFFAKIHHLRTKKGGREDKDENFYSLDMDVLRVHLHRSCSGPLKWHSLSQFPSSEKQPEKRVKLNNIRKT